MVDNRIPNILCNSHINSENNFADYSYLSEHIHYVTANLENNMLAIRIYRTFTHHSITVTYASVNEKKLTIERIEISVYKQIQQACTSKKVRGMGFVHQFTSIML